MSGAAYELHEWAHMNANVWRACEGAATTAVQAGIEDHLSTDPAANAGRLAQHDACMSCSPMRSTSTPGWPADMSYMGPFYPIRNEPPMHHIVRVGWDTPKHPDEEHVDFWTLAHGLPARVVSVRWTRRAIIEAANEARHARCTGHPVQPRQRTNTSAPRLTAPQFVGIGTRRT